MHCLPARRRFAAVLLCALLSALAVPAASSAATHGTPVHRGARVHRRGGTVRPAWPRRGRAPATALGRWLARQVGPVRVLTCAERPARARAACRRAHGASAPGVAHAADTGALTGTIGTPTGGGAGQLQLVRSYAIPADDPSYARLLNVSWTYDSAVSAAAFAEIGDTQEARQLLDQLSALQNTDGSIDFSFNVASGAGQPLIRSGTIAWVGLAAAAYDQAAGASTYLKTETLAANYLLSLQGPTGLIRGGPDVQWASTEHNLAAYAFLAALANELQRGGNSAAASTYQAAAAQVSAGIEKYLFVQDATGAWLREGLNDNVEALDVQALGAMYLQGIGQGDLGALVLSHAQSAFALGPRPVSLSADPAAYNETYSGKGNYSGYEPYSGVGVPDVLWFEGTAEMRMATAAYAQNTSALDQSMSRWESITAANAGAPLQADQTVTSAAYGVEYHVWPAAAAAAWVILSQSSAALALLTPPLPTGTTAVTAWNKVRGGNLITTYPNGSVDMTGGGGERRVLAGSATGADYTVTADATMSSGDGWGLWVRASADASTAYCVQVDHGFGKIVLRERQNDLEAVPLAVGSPPTGFNWYGQPHLLSVTVAGNTLTATLDGTMVLNVPNLTAASAAAVAQSYGLTPPVVPPPSGYYGLRAWNATVVHFQAVTAGPAN